MLAFRRTSKFGDVTSEGEVPKSMVPTGGMSNEKSNSPVLSGSGRGLFGLPTLEGSDGGKEKGQRICIGGWQEAEMCESGKGWESVGAHTFARHADPPTQTRENENRPC